MKFATSMNILAEIRRTYDNDSEYTESQLLDALVMAEVLVVDDFGTEKATQWVRDKFYQIVNSRYVERKITIFTSNEPILVMAEVLVVDDFGTEKATQWVRDKFYQIVNSRYVERKITIFTSNEPIQGLDYDERITNRIKERCYQIDFPEESVREHIYQENRRNLYGSISTRRICRGWSKR